MTEGTCVQCGRPGKPRQLTASETTTVCEACLTAAKRDVLDRANGEPGLRGR